MEPKDKDKPTVAAPSSHVSPSAPLTADQQAALRASQAPQSTADGAYSVGDTVTIDATILGIAGKYLTLAVKREPITEGRAADPTDGGTTITLATTQVRKS